MEKFKKYFNRINSRNGSNYQTAYSYFKPYMIEQIVKIRKNISLRGRPVEMSYDKFLDALFFVVDEGSRYRTSNLFGIPKSTFTRHVKYLSDHNILEIIYLSFLSFLSFAGGSLLEAQCLSAH